MNRYERTEPAGTKTGGKGQIIQTGDDHKGGITHEEGYETHSP
jgi:hypothetical protein